ncbi:MAG TPA: rRNA maturation RNase YbeY [Terriglobia bacterium]|nr:rRNA maturation RNase YbeY [Terriglobia bacterium]
MRDPDSSHYNLFNRQRRHPVDTAALRRLIPRMVDDIGLTAPSFSVVFITDAAMRSYNRTYRGMDKPTDVLSFSGDGDELGDILISTETAYRQAAASRALDFDANIARLVLHGLLHLAGYDHETDQGEMRAIERRLRRRYRC